MTGNELKENRIEIELSEEAMGEQLGVSGDQIRQWEAVGEGVAFGEFTGVLDAAVNWIAYETTRPSDEERAALHARVEAALESSGRLLAERRQRDRQSSGGGEDSV